MRELRKKTLLTIFAILTAMLAAGLTIYNTNSYRREYMSVERALNIFDDRGRAGGGAPGGGVPESNAPRSGEPFDLEGKLPEPENMMIMDNEVYTVKLGPDGEITDIYSHGNVSGDFAVKEIAAGIITAAGIMDGNAPGPGDITYIGNLYRAAFSYKYRNHDSIVIINNRDKADKLRILLLESVIIFVILEVFLFAISRLITGWIVKPAEEAFKRQKEFIADASHELKTPLAVIMASADELEKETVENSENAGRDGGNGAATQKVYIENIRYESDRMNRLISGLLNLSKLEDGNISESYKDEDLSRIIEKTCLSYEGVAFEQGVIIQPVIEEGIRFKCSKDEMEKLFSTILDNAVKHSYKDTEIRVNARRNKGGINVKIINKGDPIPDEDREKIFERFYRSDRSRNRDDNRYGLGLAIARQIAKNHNGDIKAYSSEGDTTFEIILND
ncbi:MAG: HAMP domain-containing histidine kinase [Lachnospiraceae bacterium]|nr:HAMP domain-containing histidine kinase [Lachnospiraceae bacterium]